MDRLGTAAQIVGGIDAGTQEEEATDANPLAEGAVVQQRARSRVCDLSAMQEAEVAPPCVRELRHV
jgi:hypothetical protein